MRPFLAAAILAAALLVARSAVALGPCEHRANLIELLAQRYHESPYLIGVTHTGSLVEVLTDSTGGTWTIIVTSPEGVSCLVFSGEGWRKQEQAVVLDPGA